LALGWLDKPYWLIDPAADLDRVRAYIADHYESVGTRSAYHKGLLKLAEYLGHRCLRPAPEKPVNWRYYLDPLPQWLADDVRAHVAHRSRAWLPEVRRRSTIDLLSHLTTPLRWLAAHATLAAAAADLTPDLWFDYLDARLTENISPVTLNHHLGDLQDLLQFLADQGRPICQRMLRVEPLKEGPRLPRDAPLTQLRALLAQVEADAASAHAGVRRTGLMDRAWFLLMLHSGLRTGEARRLRLKDLGLEDRRVRIEQSKGLKDRIVCLSQAAVDALCAYLEVRGSACPAPGQREAGDHVFIYRHLPLSFTYCSERLRTYGRRCGFHVTPHQLRHSCATLLLNAGAPILTVQTILGHQHIDTTLGYARLYDGTVAADYYRAMQQVESRMELQEVADDSAPTGGQLLALVDALFGGTLNVAQRETVHALRGGILALVEQEASKLTT